MIAAALLSLALAPAALSRGGDLCAAAARVAPDRVCRPTGHGVVLAVDAAEAARLAALANAGEARLQRHFGRPPPPYAVVEDAAPGVQKALNAQGFRRTLPWLTPAEFEAAAEASVRRGAEAQAKVRGLDAAAAQAAVAKAVQAYASKSAAQFTARQAGALPHELGHGWYVELFWPGVPVDAGSHYGGPGPDWLDETAAVLMEDEGLTADRRAQFEKLYRDRSPEHAAERAQLVDLPRFLHMDHPMAAQQKSLTAAAGGAATRDKPGVIVLTGEEARKAAGDAALFYLQSRAFADFLIDRTGDPAVFGDIGTAFGRGETIEQWLARRGRAYRLGSDVAALDRHWRAWLAVRFPEAPAARVSAPPARPGR